MSNTGIKKERLLAEVEDLLRNMPTPDAFLSRTGESLAWLGQVAAVIENWDSLKGALLTIYTNEINRELGVASGLRKLLTLLHEAQHDLRMKTLGPTNLAVPEGGVFEYFDEIRKVIELAKQDLFFVDPYLDAEFVSRYLPHVATGVTVRLLAREKLPTLLPAVGAFAQQTGTVIKVRSAPNFHDRLIFTDRTDCYLSGASFKDGAKSAPTTLTQITDAFGPLLQTYEDLGKQGLVER